MLDYLTKWTSISDITQHDRKVFLIFCIVVAFLIVDDMIHWVSDIIIPALISTPSIVAFTIITVAGTFGQIFLLGFLKNTSKEIRQKDSHIRSTHRIVTAVQYALVTIAIILILEILLTRQYHTIILTVVMAIVTFTTAGILSLFAYRLFSWFKLNRSSVIVLLYGLSFSIYVFSTVLVNSRAIYFLSLKDAVVNSSSPVVFPHSFLEPGSLLDNLFTAYTYTNLISFGLLISATAILLHHYSKRLGKVRFWIIVTLPLLYNASTILETIGVYTPVTDTEWFYWWLYMSLNATAGGILFGFAFMKVKKTLREDSVVRQYMTVAAFGLVLMFISEQVTLVGASYPPYGLVTLAFQPLASYMIFLGLYSTAVSISQDNQLRRSIKRAVVQDSNLLSSIGTAHMEQEIQRTVSSMKDVVQEQEKALEEKTGIEANLEEDEMKKYLEEVMQEVGKVKKPNT